MKTLKRVLIGLCVAVAMGVAPVAANAEMNSNAVDSNQVTSTVETAPVTPTPKNGKVPVTPIEGDDAACDAAPSTGVQQCVATQPRSAISSGTSVRFDWSVMVAFAVADIAILVVAYRYESTRDKQNTYAQHYNGRLVVR